MVYMQVIIIKAKSSFTNITRLVTRANIWSKLIMLKIDTLGQDA